jgi:hypothetical protein
MREAHSSSGNLKRGSRHLLLLLRHLLLLLLFLLPLLLL